MIAFVEGTVEEVAGDRLVVRAGAFGVEVLATPKTLAAARPGAVVRLATHLVVREDAWTLYGFADADGRAAFRHLLGVGGVGPKLALGILSALTPAQMALAVATGDAALLATAGGSMIGPALAGVAADALGTPVMFLAAATLPGALALLL
ncbi:MAG: OB-fold domain-containing protein, partial [Trueperaceae bacterium]|nr:OB-fold domain-containing protein [Trueperaceae bacterium]